LKDGATTARETTNELKDAAADREKPEGCRAPHCFSEYGTPCGTCPVEKSETPFFTEQQERALDRCEAFDAANLEPETDT
jgi:hypothetical protein